MDTSKCAWPGCKVNGDIPFSVGDLCLQHSRDARSLMDRALKLAFERINIVMVLRSYIDEADNMPDRMLRKRRIFAAKSGERRAIKELAERGINVDFTYISSDGVQAIVNE